VLSKFDKDDFNGFVETKDKTIESKLGSDMATSHGLGSTLLLKIVALQLATSQFFCPMSFLRQNGAVFHKLKPFLWRLKYSFR
jgi:hypothetical protein